MSRPAAVSDDPPAWVRDATFYQVFPDRFAASSRVHKPGRLEAWDAPPTLHGFKGGDLLGIAEHLDYIAGLGATALYLNPIFASASNHRYHTYDYLRVDPLLGGDEALRELLDAAHARDMRVVLDGVFNHASRGFWPFHHLLEAGAASPYRGWFYLDERQLSEGRPLRAYPSETDTLAGELDAAARAGSRSLEALGYRAWWDLPALPKLNVSNPEVRSYLLGVAEHWIRFGADGWRLDVPQEIDDRDFWADFRARVKAVNPDAYLVGEIWHFAPDWVGAGAFDGLMNYPLAWALIGFAAGSRLDLGLVASHGIMSSALQPLDGAAFAARVQASLDAYAPRHAEAHLNLLGSHDTPRVLSVCGGDPTAVRLAVLLLVALPGAPSIYYGDEIGLAGGLDPDCRRSFPWQEEAWDGSACEFVRAALRARKEEPAMRQGAFRVVAAEGGAYAFQRSAGDSRLLIAANAADEPTSLEIGDDTAVAASEPLLATGPTEATWRDAPGRGSIQLPPRWGGIWRLA
jgi:cyclomaltodextrinase / maltogenic alpha-amylase / neopullulanase